MLYDKSSKAMRDLRESCCICLKEIRTGQIFVRTASQSAHYRCAKKRHWQKRPKVKFKPEFAAKDRPIKLIKQSR